MRDAERFFSHLFPGVARLLHPSSFNRRLKKLRRLEWSHCGGAYSPSSHRRAGDVARRLDIAGSPPSAPGFSVGRLGKRFGGSRMGVRWGTFSVYGVKLHLLCATNRVPLSYELTPANVADISLSEELVAEAALGEGIARRLLADTWPTEASS